MIDNVAIKSKSREQIKDKIGILFLIMLFTWAISFVASNFIPFVGSIIEGIIITPLVSFSMAVIYLNITEGKKPVFTDVFVCFDSFVEAIVISVLESLFVLLWSLLFIIPGIVKAYSYAMALYIVADDPSVPALEAIDRSKKMMDGHKMELFMLDLSFIGWILLSILTFGVLFVWVTPYMATARANFYKSLNGETVVEATEPAPEAEAPAEEAPADESASEND